MIDRKKWIYRLALGIGTLILGLAACIPVEQPGPQQAIPTSTVNPTQTAMPSPVTASEKEIIMGTKTPPGEANDPSPEWQTDGETPFPPASLPEAVRTTLDRLAQKLKISSEEVKVVDFQERQWRNSCLGITRANEMCADVITPGWLILLEANGQQYEAHTNRDGSQVRFR